MFSRVLSIFLSAGVFYVAGVSAAFTPEQALSFLKEGNRRFVLGASEHPNRSQERRQAIAGKQEPFAVIVACSDSRVPPEMIFDTGFGDLFVVRVAGNAIGPLEEESIQYAVNVLKCPFILVIGHENCGAVQAVIQKKTEGIPTLAAILEPAVKEAKKQGPVDLLIHATKKNAVNMKRHLLGIPTIEKLVKERALDLKAGYYNFRSGEVEWMGA